MTWFLDVVVPALERLRILLDKYLPKLPWVLAAVVLAVSEGHMVLRVICLGLCLFLHGRIVKRCRRKDGSWPTIVYASAFFPLLMISAGFMGAPLAWQICMLVWAKYKR